MTIALYPLISIIFMVTTISYRMIKMAKITAGDLIDAIMVGIFWPIEVTLAIVSIVFFIIGTVGYCSEYADKLIIWRKK